MKDEVDERQERDLLQRMQSGSAKEIEAAMGDACSLFGPRVFRVCRDMIGRVEEAEDATQEVLFALVRSVATFRGDSKLSTWIYRVAIRVAIRHRARLKNRTTVPLKHEDMALASPDLLDQEDNAVEVRVALARLSAIDRSVLSLFAVEGLSHQQIGEIMGVPEGTVWSRLHSARKRLAGLMGM